MTAPCASAVQSTAKSRASCRIIEPVSSNADYDRLLNLSDFSFVFAGDRKLLAVAFKLVRLDAADATGEANLAAHRCSNFL
jgi:hypothetical protein